MHFLIFVAFDTDRLSICLYDVCHVTNICLFIFCCFLFIDRILYNFWFNILLSNAIMFLSKLTLRYVTAATKHCRVVVAASSVHAVHRRFVHQDNSKNSSDSGTEESNKDADLLNTPRRESVRNILQSKPSNQLYQVYVSNCVDFCLMSQL